MVDMEVLAVQFEGDDIRAFRPCVDCGQTTGSFCDAKEMEYGGVACMAKQWIPEEKWLVGHRTPFCTTCEEKREMCHFCRGVAWCTPEEWELN